MNAKAGGYLICPMDNQSSAGPPRPTDASPGRAANEAPLSVVCAQRFFLCNFSDI